MVKKYTLPKPIILRQAARTAVRTSARGAAAPSAEELWAVTKPLGSYERICRRLIPRISRVRPAAARRAPANYVPASEPKRSGSAPSGSTSFWPLLPAGRPRPHETRPYGRAPESAVGARRRGSRPCDGNTAARSCSPAPGGGGRAGCRG